MTTAKTMTSVLILAALLTGCTTTPPVVTPPVSPVAPQVTEIGRWSGPDVSLMVKHWDRMCSEVGVDGPYWRSQVTVTQSYSETDPNAGSRQWGPASCDQNGCWHGIAYRDNATTYRLYWPKGRHEGVIAHEVMHILQWLLVDLGVMPAEQLRDADPPGHPYSMDVDGKTFVTKRIVNWRWPALVERAMIFAKDAWDTLCGTQYEQFEKGGGI